MVVRAYEARIHIEKLRRLFAELLGCESGCCLGRCGVCILSICRWVSWGQQYHLWINRPF